MSTIRSTRLRASRCAAGLVFAGAALLNAAAAAAQESTETTEPAGPVVTVVDDWLGLPVPRAEVSFFDSAAVDPDDLSRAQTSSLRRKRLWRGGETLVTGLEGTVQLPAAVGQLYVRAERGAAEDWAVASEGELRFELKADVPIPMRIVGTDGRAVPGYRVGFPSLPSDADLLDFRLDDFLKSTTDWDFDPQTGAVFDWPRESLADDRGRWLLSEWQMSLLRGSLAESALYGEDGYYPVQFALDAVGLDAPALELTADRILRGEAVFELPEHGSVRLSLRDANGAPAARGVPYAVVPAGLEPDVDGPASIRYLDPRRYREHDGSGELLFPVVGLGQRFDVHGAHGVTTIEGPTVDGEVVEVELLGPQATVTIRGRLEGRFGSPPSGPAWVGYASRVDGEWVEVTEADPIQVAPDGSFEVHGAWRAIGRAEELRLRVAFADGFYGVWKYAAAPLPADLTRAGHDGRPIDLGAVRSIIDENVTGGYLVDDDGEPLTGAEIYLRHWNPNAPAADDRRDWLGWSVVDENGRFWIEHIPPVAGGDYGYVIFDEGGHVISDGDDDYLGDDGSIPAELFSTSERLVVPSSARVRLSCSLPRGIGDLIGPNFDRARLALLVETDDWFTLREIDLSGELQTLRIDREGPARLSVVYESDRYQTVSKPVALDLLRGVTLRDPALDPIRIGSGLRTVRFDLVAADGIGVEGAGSAEAESNGAAAAGAIPETPVSVHFLQWLSGVGEFYTFGGAVELPADGRVLVDAGSSAALVMAEGYYDYRARSLLPTVRVPLVPSGRVTITVEGSLASELAFVEAELAGTDWREPLQLEAPGRYGFHPRYAGTYDLVWSWPALDGQPAVESIDGQLELPQASTPRHFTVTVPERPWSSQD